MFEYQLARQSAVEKPKLPQQPSLPASAVCRSWKLNGHVAEPGIPCVSGVSGITLGATPGSVVSPISLPSQPVPAKGNLSPATAITASEILRATSQQLVAEAVNKAKSKSYKFLTADSTTTPPQLHRQGMFTSKPYLPKPRRDKNGFSTLSFEDRVKSKFSGRKAVPPPAADVMDIGSAKVQRTDDPEDPYAFPDSGPKDDVPDSVQSGGSSSTSTNSGISVKFSPGHSLTNSPKSDQPSPPKSATPTSSPSISSNAAMFNLCNITVAQPSLTSPTKTAMVTTSVSMVSSGSGTCGPCSSSNIATSSTATTPTSGSSMAKLYPELAEKLERSRPRILETRFKGKILSSPNSRTVARSMNRLQTKIAQNKIKDKLKKTQESQSPLSSCVYDSLDGDPPQFPLSVLPSLQGKSEGMVLDIRGQLTPSPDTVSKLIFDDYRNLLLQRTKNSCNIQDVNTAKIHSNQHSPQIARQISDPHVYNKKDVVTSSLETTLTSVSGSSVIRQKSEPYLPISNLQKLSSLSSPSSSSSLSSVPSVLDSSLTSSSSPLHAPALPLLSLHASQATTMVSVQSSSHRDTAALLIPTSCSSVTVPVTCASTLAQARLIELHHRHTLQQINTALLSRPPPPPYPGLKNNTGTLAPKLQQPVPNVTIPVLSSSPVPSSSLASLSFPLSLPLPHPSPSPVYAEPMLTVKQEPIESINVSGVDSISSADLLYRLRTSTPLQASQPRQQQQLQQPSQQQPPLHIQSVQPHSSLESQKNSDLFWPVTVKQELPQWPVKVTAELHQPATVKHEPQQPLKQEPTEKVPSQSKPKRPPRTKKTISSSALLAAISNPSASQEFLNKLLNSSSPDQIQLQAGAKLDPDLFAANYAKNRHYPATLFNALSHLLPVIKTKLRNCDGVMGEQEAKAKFKTDSAAKFYSCYTDRKIHNHTLLRFGVASSDDDSEEEDKLPWQPSWFVASSDEEAMEEDDQDEELSFHIRTTKLTLLRARLRRQSWQSRKTQRANINRQRVHNDCTSALINSSREDARLTVKSLQEVLHKPQQPIDRYKRRGIERRICRCTNDDEKMCKDTALPFTNHCMKHVMYNVNQQLFDYCTAKFADNTQCCVPVFDFRHELPLCCEHAIKMDNYQRLLSQQPQKRPRKKTRPSALTRPPRKGKKKRNQSRKSARNKGGGGGGKDDVMMDDEDDAGVGDDIDVDGDTGMQSQHQKDDEDDDDEEEQIDVEHSAEGLPDLSGTIAAVETSDTSSHNNSELDGMNLDISALSHNLSKGLPPELTDLDDTLSPDTIDKSFELPLDQASKLLEDHDFFNKIPDAFDIFSGKNGEFEVTKEESDALEMALIAVSKDVKTLQELSQSIGTDEELTKQLAVTLMNANLAQNMSTSSSTLEDAFPSGTVTATGAGDLPILSQDTLSSIAPSHSTAAAPDISLPPVSRHNNRTVDETNNVLNQTTTLSNPVQGYNNQALSSQQQQLQQHITNIMYSNGTAARLPTFPVIDQSVFQASHALTNQSHVNNTTFSQIHTEQIVRPVQSQVNFLMTAAVPQQKHQQPLPTTQLTMTTKDVNVIDGTKQQVLNTPVTAAVVSALSMNSSGQIVNSSPQQQQHFVINSASAANIASLGHVLSSLNPQYINVAYGANIAGPSTTSPLPQQPAPSMSTASQSPHRTPPNSDLASVSPLEARLHYNLTTQGSRRGGVGLTANPASPQCVLATVASVSASNPQLALQLQSPQHHHQHQRQQHPQQATGQVIQHIVPQTSSPPIKAGVLNLPQQQPPAHQQAQQHAHNQPIQSSLVPQASHLADAHIAWQSSSHRDTTNGSPGQIVRTVGMTMDQGGQQTQLMLPVTISDNKTLNHTNLNPSSNNLNSTSTTNPSSSITGFILQNGFPLSSSQQPTLALQVSTSPVIVSSSSAGSPVINHLASSPTTSQHTTAVDRHQHINIQQQQQPQQRSQQRRQQQKTRQQKRLLTGAVKATAVTTMPATMIPNLKHDLFSGAHTTATIYNIGKINIQSHTQVQNQTTSRVVAAHSVEGSVSELLSQGLIKILEPNITNANVINNSKGTGQSPQNTSRKSKSNSSSVT